MLFDGAKVRLSLFTELYLWTVPVVDLASATNWQGNSRPIFYCYPAAFGG